MLSAPNRNGEQERIATYLLGQHAKTMDGLVAKAKKEYEGHDTHVCKEKEQAVFTNTQVKHVIKDGQIVEASPIEPTAEEVAAAARATLDAEYQAARDELQGQYLTALLNGNNVAAAAIQQDATDLDAAYVEQLQELTKEV
ncbi:hypothetical protein [Veillonella sp.]|uniref:hypothetical protein n=1 Tax=Veillonella sp. TaxID=1926307 RepID=UPI0025ECE6A5|nr:hypothetical protein [Veillonella sp.]